MSTINEKVRQHFRSVRDGKFKPQFVPAILDDDPWIVLVGNIPVHLEDYYAAQAKRDREEARRLVAAPNGPHPYFKKMTQESEKNVGEEKQEDSEIIKGGDQKKTV